jgi:O-antigen/teichoic acid export membrane protein
VGLAAALVAAMNLLGTLGMLGLGTLLAGEFARAEDDQRGRLVPALAIAAFAGTALGIAFGIAAPRRLGLEELGGKLGPIALFAAGAGLTSLSQVLDQALIGLQRGGLQLARNVLAAVAKLVLVAIAAAGALTLGGVGLYGTWVAGLALSLLWVAARLRLRGAGAHRRPRESLRSVIREWRTEAVKHHLLNLSLRVSSLAMPLVAAATVSVEAVAYYYTASLITSVLAYGAVAISFALYTAGVRNERELARILRFTLRTSFAFVIAANLVLLVGARLILSVFGSGYVQNGATVMRLLGLAVLLQVVKDHYIAIARIRGRLTQAALLSGAGAALEIGLAAVGGVLGGLDGVALGGIAALVVEVIVMSRTITRELGWGRWAAPEVGS